MVNVINSVIGGFSSVNVVELAALTLWLQLSDYSQLSYYTMQLQLHRTINEKNRAGDAPITFEEIGMAMIELRMLPCCHVILGLTFIWCTYTADW